MNNCVLLLILFGILGCNVCEGFSAAAGDASSALKGKKAAVTQSSREYRDAISTIDASSRSGVPSDDLYDAVRVIDKNVRNVYPDEESKEDLWKRAYGSWKLVFATGGGRSQTFKAVPVFAFAMLDETNFGNGVGINQDTILLSLLGPHELVTKRRMMMINIDDVFFGSKNVTKNVPGFLGEGIGLGKRPSDYRNNNKSSSGRAPAFVFIAASETSLVARGGSGGIAIWTRLEKDIRPAAYGMPSSP